MTSSRTLRCLLAYPGYAPRDSSVLSSSSPRLVARSFFQQPARQPRMSDCLFCRIVAGQIPAKKVHEDALSIGFLDINPQAPHHALFIPKRHVATLNDATPED